MSTSCFKRTDQQKCMHKIYKNDALILYFPHPFLPAKHTHTRMHARTHTHSHTRTHAQTHTHSNTHTHGHTRTRLQASIHYGSSSLDERALTSRGYTVLSKDHSTVGERVVCELTSLMGCHIMPRNQQYKEYVVSPFRQGFQARSRDLRGGRWSWTLTFAQKRS